MRMFLQSNKATQATGRHIARANCRRPTPLVEQSKTLNYLRRNAKALKNFIKTGLAVLPALLAACGDPALTEREQKVIASLSLSHLPPPFTRSNRVAQNPAAAKLGEQLFNDPQLSSTGTISCASCHDPQQHFIDGLAKAQGIGTLNRNTPALAGAAWLQWQYWDGRRDSLWSQALTPLETKEEMGTNRVAVTRLILGDENYRQQYVALFGDIALQPADIATEASPIGNDQEKRNWLNIDKQTQELINTVFVNVGKSIGAFEQTLPPAATRFDRFIESVRQGKPDNSILSKDELRGMRLFINGEKTQCLECHNGPLFSNGDFHNIGTGRFDANQPGELLDFGRLFGVQAALINEFNCQGRFSDAGKGDCKHLQFLNRSAASHMQGAFRTPTLRNAANTAPYFHDGRFTTLQQVVRHYSSQQVTTGAGQNELRSFELNEKEIQQLSAFLSSLAVIE